MWPPEVERIAAVVRAAGIEARLEELALRESDFPGAAVRADAFDCDGRMTVALVAAELETDTRKLGCNYAQRVAIPPFPYTGTRIRLDQSLLVHRTIWIEAGASRYVLGVSPAQLSRFLQAEIGDFAADNVERRGPE